MTRRPYPLTPHGTTLVLFICGLLAWAAFNIIFG